MKGSNHLRRNIFVLFKFDILLQYDEVLFTLFLDLSQ